MFISIGIILRDIIVSHVSENRNKIQNNLNDETETEMI